MKKKITLTLEEYERFNELHKAVFGRELNEDCMKDSYLDYWCNDKFKCIERKFESHNSNHLLLEAKLNRCLSRIEALEKYLKIQFEDTTSKCKTIEAHYSKASKKKQKQEKPKIDNLAEYQDYYC